MNNLLGEVTDGFHDEPEDDSSASGSHDLDLEEQKQQQQQQHQTGNGIDYMGHFFREMDNLKEEMTYIGIATKAIRELHEKALSATTTQEEEQLSKQLKPIIEASNDRAKRTKTLLGLLSQETQKLQADNTLSASDLRVRKNLQTTITKKFVDDMKVYQQAQQEYKNALRQKAKRQIVAVKPDVTDEEVDQVMKSEGGRDALLQQAVLSNSVNSEIQSTFDKVSGKYQDVLTLEQSVTELHQMFLDFALLTEQQGELLDQIEYQVREANDHVEIANVDVSKAIDYQSAIRKKQCWIIAIVSGAVLILSFIIFG